MNRKVISEAFRRISKRHNEALAEYEKHLEEVENKIPEIVQLNGQIANTSRNIIVTALSKGVDVKSQVERIKSANLYAQKRVDDLLTQHGYPKDYLSINYHCKDCCDTGYVNDSTTYCKCVNRLVSEINAEWINKNTSLQLSSFETFSLDFYDKDKYYDINGIMISEYKNILDIFNDCKNYAEHFNLTYPSILMMGPTGLGKTHLSLAIARVVSNAGYSVAYNSAMDLFSAIEKEKFNNKYNSDGMDTLESVLTVDLLILDDLGVEYDNRFYKSVLYNIINTRIIRNLPTIINTNLTVEDLNEKYENRITSRLFTYQIMVFYGRDIRQRKDYFKKGFEPVVNRSFNSINHEDTQATVKDGNDTNTNGMNKYY
jgi:DNA replication protein DnaC